MKNLALNSAAVGVLVLSGILSARAECAKLVLTADPNYPPMHWYDGKSLQGASIEIAKRVLDDLKINYEVRYVGPFPRILTLAEHGDVDMIATLKKTPEREKFLLFPNTAALSNPVAVFTSREHPVHYKEWSDLVGLRGGITRGNLFGGGFDEYLASNLKVEEANRPENSFEKLALGRIDYFVTGYYAGMAYLLKRGDEARFVAQSSFVVDTPNYVVLTRKGKCADKLEAIDSHLALLKKSGVLDELIRKNFVKWKANPTVATQ